MTDLKSDAAVRTPERFPRGPHSRSDRPPAQRLGAWLLEHMVWILIVVFSIGASISNPFFFSLANLQNVLVQASTLGLLVFAVSFPLLIGEIDLSVVGVMLFSGLVGVELVKAGAPGLLAILGTFVVGALIGLLNGLFVAITKMHSQIGRAHV